MPSVALSYFDEHRRMQVFRTEAPSFTVGSAPVCDLILADLAPMACTIYLAEGGHFALEAGESLAVDGREGSGYLRDGGTLTLGGWLSLRVAIGSATPPASAGPAPPAASPRERTSRSRPKASAQTRPGTVNHRPGLAVAFSLLAGAGQAYNGRPVKGALFLVTSVLLLPWIWAFVDAHREASQIVAGGGRTGRGGILWVLFHGWFALNVALTTAVVLTVTGLLS